MHKKFEINLTKIKGACQSGRKAITHNSRSDLPLGVKDFFGLVYIKVMSREDRLILYYSNPFFSF